MKTNYLRPRFSLRTMLIVLTLLAIMLAAARIGYVRYIVPRRPLPWRDFSAQRLEQLLADDKPVLIHFDANWSPSSKYVYAAVLETPEVRSAVYQDGYIPLHADCTQAAGQGWAALQGYGARRMPLTVIYRRGDPEPIILMDIIDQDALLEALKER